MSGSEVTLIIDGREVTATEGEMLHDAASEGDVEIPVFCYEPKLGEPVGACRMCLVEIEGIPKLQTSCSTPVRDGMVVHTRTEQVKHAQSAVVEFLLVNHPLDCPVCDKGGECPLQDITMGWGPGKSRVIDEKRHFEKPIELSPLVAIDRERCILCYRCVRFSQEVAEDEQLQLLERGDRTFVGTFDDRPYVAPFHGNITDLCPVGALTSYTYRFRARPWDIEQAGSVCTLCPSQCNVSFTVRDEQVKRVVARDNPEVDDGWLCDRGRYGFEMFGAEERVDGPAAAGRRRGRAGRRRSRRPPTGCGPAGGASAAIVGDASNEEGYLVQRILREALGSPHVDSRPSRGPGREALVRLAAARASRPGSATSTTPTRSSSSAPTRCTARRSSTCGSARRSAATAPGWPSRPSARPRSTAAPRRSPATPPARRAHFLAELAAALRRRRERRHAAGRDACAAPSKVVVLWGERIARDGDGAIAALLDARRRPRPRRARRAPACSKSPSRQRPRPARGRLPARRRPGPDATSRAARQARATEEIRAALESGELKALLLFGVDPLRDFPDTEAWKAALAAADHVVAFSTFENATTAEADVVFPLETHAEKDGTVTHPDGRLQRVRPSAAAPATSAPTGASSPSSPLALGHDTGIDSQPTAFAALADAVPFYAGITDADIGGRGIRWQDRPLPRPASQLGRGPPAPTRRTLSAERVRRAGAVAHRVRESADGSLALGHLPRPLGRARSPSSTRRSVPRARSSASRSRSADAERLGLKSGDEVQVGQNGTSVDAKVDDQGTGRRGRLLPHRGHRRTATPTRCSTAARSRSRSRRSSE